MCTKVCSLACRCYQNPEINVLSLFTACVQKLSISPKYVSFNRKSSCSRHLLSFCGQSCQDNNSVLCQMVGAQKWEIGAERTDQVSWATSPASAAVLRQLEGLLYPMCSKHGFPIHGLFVAFSNPTDKDITDCFCLSSFC